MGDILVTPAQCAEKYITHTRSMTERYTPAIICGHTHMHACIAYSYMHRQIDRRMDGQTETQSRRHIDRERGGEREIEKQADKLGHAGDKLSWEHILVTRTQCAEKYYFAHP